MKVTALPAEGHDGAVPAWPLPLRTVKRWEIEDKHRFQVTDSDETELVRQREHELWAWAWSTPQACAWSLPSEVWRVHSIAMWVRTAVVCESSEATAADKNSLHRFADQIGLTPAGLKENGWAVAADEVGAKAQERQEQPKRERRLRVAGDAQ